MNNPFDDLSSDDFTEALDPKNWTEETRLHTPTFEALLKSDGTLWLSGPALQEGFSIEATQALTRFLSERVKLPPVETTYNFSDFTPKRIDSEQKCSFCDRDLGVTLEHDASGKPFYCCGECWAHVLHGGIMPDDITPVIAEMRRVNHLPIESE